MIDKVSKELRDRMLAAPSPISSIAVIVTMRAGVDLNAVDLQKLKVYRTFENIPAVAGTLPVRDLDEVVKLSEVERVDYDGEVRIL